MKVHHYTLCGVVVANISSCDVCTALNLSGQNAMYSVKSQYSRILGYNNVFRKVNKCKGSDKLTVSIFRT